MNHSLKFLCLIGLTSLCLKANSQVDTIRLKMIQSLTKYIKSYYLSPGIASQMCDTINWKLKNGKYDTLLNPDEFAFEITKDLRRVSKDEHISVTMPDHKPFDQDMRNSKLDKMTYKQNKRYFKKLETKYTKRTKGDMFTYGDIKILPGNIGYVEIKDFRSTSYIKKQNKGRIRIKSVMRFLKNTNSIIIDLRNNQGGFIRQAATFCSYFSLSRSNYFITTELHSRYDSSGIQKEIRRTDKILTSKKIDNALTRSKNIYILISKRTFSAAELSTYKIKQFDTASIILGEKTNGGSNAHEGGTTEKYFSAIIPCVNVFDENNSDYTFEAKGITPDISTSADSAFVTAYRLALNKKILPDTKPKYFKKQRDISTESSQYFQKFYPEYLGNYRKIEIIQEGDKLFMIYDKYEKIKLFAESTDFFTGDNIQYVKFLRDNNGHVSAIQVRRNNEFSEIFHRQ